MRHAIVGAAFLALVSVQAMGETPASVSAAIPGLAGINALENSKAGKAALTANLKATGDIQSGKAHQPLLLTWADQQKQALKDAFITSENANELADALGSKLGDVYQTATHYTRPAGGGRPVAGSLSKLAENLLQYASGVAQTDSSAGKFLFANGTSNGTAPADPDLVLKAGKATDVFGRFYGVPAGTTRSDLCGEGLNPYGNARPFQTEPSITPISGSDFFGDPADSKSYLCMAPQDLRKNPSYPSGHTTYGYTESLVLALLVPERYPQMAVRGAEYGNSRIILGAHYAMDVLAGRTLALYDLAQLLANKQGYVGQTRGTQIDDFQKALTDARAELTPMLAMACGDTVAACAKQDTSRFADLAKDRAFYNSTQTYGLGTVSTRLAKRVEDVAKLAPEAGNLLTAAYPYLSLAQANAILTKTEGPGGGFLDNGTGFGVYSRLNLFEASLRAMALAPKAKH